MPVVWFGLLGREFVGYCVVRSPLKYARILEPTNLPRVKIFFKIYSCSYVVYCAVVNAHVMRMMEDCIDSGFRTGRPVCLLVLVGVPCVVPMFPYCIFKLLQVPVRVHRVVL
jgi:hypothetical protein